MKIGTIGTFNFGVMKCSGTMIEWSIVNRCVSEKSKPAAMPPEYNCIPNASSPGITACGKSVLSSFGPSIFASAPIANVGQLSKKNVLT